jgi:hypothetical protein
VFLLSVSGLGLDKKSPQGWMPRGLEGTSYVYLEATARESC